MRHSIYTVIVVVMLVTLASQSAFAQSDDIRKQDPLSVMVELSTGGPNGTIGAHLDYDFAAWGGASLGVGYSGWSKSVNTSAMLNTRLLRGGSARSESALQLSLGLSYRGESTVEGLQLWGETVPVERADYTLYASTSIGYALAHHNGFRFQVYVGWDQPLTAGNVVSETWEVDGSEGRELLGSEPGNVNGTPSVGLAFGGAF